MTQDLGGILKILDSVAGNIPNISIPLTINDIENVNVLDKTLNNNSNILNLGRTIALKFNSEDETPLVQFHTLKASNTDNLTIGTKQLEFQLNGTQFDTMDIVMPSDHILNIKRDRNRKKGVVFQQNQTINIKEDMHVYRVNAGSISQLTPQFDISRYIDESFKNDIIQFDFMVRNVGDTDMVLNAPILKNSDTQLTDYSIHMPSSSGLAIASGQTNSYSFNMDMGCKRLVCNLEYTCESTPSPDTYIAFFNNSREPVCCNFNGELTTT